MIVKRKYVLLSPEKRGDYDWAVHAVGCSDITRELRRLGGTQETVVLDLDDEAQCMAVIDPDALGYGMHDVKVFPCALAAHRTPVKHRPQKAAPAMTGTKTPATAVRPAALVPGPVAVPTTKPKANGAALDAAALKAEKIIAEIVEKIIEKRGTDDVGTGDQWDDDRRDTVDDYTYDLAVEVRKMRVGGAAWWRIAHNLYLPGAGPSAAQGKSGAAYARRLWERAWGKTYTDGEKAPRETKERKRERAVTTEHRPYFADTATDVQITNAVAGQEIMWFARVDTPSGAVISEQNATVHPDPRTIKIVLGPKGRVLEFYETLDTAMLLIDPHQAITKTGPRRSVYIDRIEKVGR